MGVVYEAQKDPLNLRVALKLLHPELAQQQDALTRFFAEASALSRLQIPGVVAVLDYGTADTGLPYFVMEYLPGRSLQSWIQHMHSQGQPIPLDRVLAIGWQVADSLRVAHAQGIIHRDIKPENLMLVDDSVAPERERVKILDFGIAKLVQQTGEWGCNTGPYTILGTPMYMSPEQCRRSADVDAKTDVYSLGCILYLMLSGRPPFVAQTDWEYIGLHLVAEPPSLAVIKPWLPPQVVRLLERMLVKDRAVRPTMSEVADELKAALHGAGTKRRWRERTVRTTSRWSAGLAVVLVTAALGGRLVSHQRTDSAERLPPVTPSTSHPDSLPREYLLPQAATVRTLARQVPLSAAAMKLRPAEPTPRDEPAIKKPLQARHPRAEESKKGGFLYEK